jgi:hypothetical protein
MRYLLRSFIFPESAPETIVCETMVYNMKKKSLILEKKTIITEA